ncbi:methyltransferase-like protein 15-like protein, partial [Euroglyphus maynei]
IPYHSFDGAIIDLGASSFQYDDPVRGFSFRDGPLDMRMDGDRNPRMPSAADVINTLNADELAKIFKVYGEERNAKKIAQTIVDSRFLMKRLNTTRELAELVQSVTSNAFNSKDKIGRPTHPATKIFQALRIFVNNELNELNHIIPVLSKYLKISTPSQSSNDDDNELIVNERSNGGLLAIISFHSLEDRIVKSHFVNQYDNNLLLPPKNDDYIIHPNINHNFIDQTKRLKLWKFYRKKFQIPTEEEILQNPRSRSAKLRIGLRIN